MGHIIFILVYPILFIGRFVFGKHKLRAINMPLLNSPKVDVEKCFGNNFETGTDEDGSSFHEYHINLFHVVRVWYKNDISTRYVYLSRYPSPNDDMATIMNRYGEGRGWKEIERGYLYWRDDNYIGLGCSVAPMISVFILKN